MPRWARRRNSSLSNNCAPPRPGRCPGHRAQSLAAPTNGLPPETDPYWDDSVNEVPQPFPGVLLSKGLGAQRRPGTQTAPPASPFDPMAIPNPSSCDVLNETRQYNRSLNHNFRYSILSYAWDQVLLDPDLPRNEANDNAYFSAMSANDSAVTAVAPANTRTLYFDNRTVRRDSIEDLDPYGQGTLCGRHVVTLAKARGVLGEYDYRLEDEHLRFLVGKIGGTSNWSSSIYLLPFCPTNIHDNQFLSF